MADVIVHADHHIETGPQRFVLSSGIRNVLIGGMALGLLCLILSFFADGGDPNNTRFWSNWLHNSVFFMGIAFMSLFLLAAKVLMYSGWHTVFKRVWEAYTEFLPWAIGLLAITVLSVFLHLNHMYHWADAEALVTDDLLAGKSAFLNVWWYAAAAVIIPAIWYVAFAIPMRKRSIEEDERGTGAFLQHRRNRLTAGIFLPIAAFSSAAVIWLLVMSVDAHWYSTLFAWYATASWLVATVGLTIVLLIFLKSLGYFGQVTTEHLHDLGKYMFAFSIFWTYLWFSQFMLIWYGNVGEETVYFQTRMSEFPILFWANLVLNFILPFFVLMPNTTKRKYGPLAFIAIMVVFGHWLDYFQMLKPGIMETAVHAMHGDDHALVAENYELGDPHTGLSTNEYQEGNALSGTAGNTGYDGDEDNSVLTDEEYDGDQSYGADTEHDGALERDNEAQAAIAGAPDRDVHTDRDRIDDVVEANAHDLGGHAGGAPAGEVHVGDDHAGDGHGGPVAMAGFHIPGLIEIGTFIGFLSFFFLVALNALSKANLVPANDPYLEESLHHHV